MAGDVPRVIPGFSREAEQCIFCRFDFKSRFRSGDTVLNLYVTRLVMKIANVSVIMA